MKELGGITFRFTPAPGTVEGPVHCGVCGTEMTVSRNIKGARGFAAAMAGIKSEYDEFLCPLHDELWHKQVVALRYEKSQTASAVIADLLEQEIQGVLVARQPTLADFVG